MEGDGRATGALGHSSGFQICEVAGIDAHAHLDGERNGARRRDGTLEDSSKEADFPRKCCSPAPASDLGHGTPEIEVNVIGSILRDKQCDGFGNDRGVDSVELDRPRRLGLVVRNKPHRLRGAFDERAGRNHFAHVESRTVFSTEAAKRRVGNTRHRRKNNRDRE